MKDKIARSSVMRLLAVLSTAFPILLQAPVLKAQEARFPSKAVEVVVPFAPGGITDVGSRIVSEALARDMGVPVVIRNQAGGGGLIGATAYISAAPDGYTILAGIAGSIVSNVLLSKTPPFDPRRDLKPIGYIGDSPVSFLVHKNSPFKSFDDLVKFAKSNPGKVRVGVSSLGGETHIMFTSILKDTKVDLKMIPYPGTGQSVAALLGKHIDGLTLSLPAAMPYAKSGDMRVLLLTGRSPIFPSVPAGPDVSLPSVSINFWLGYLALPKTPQAAFARLVSAVGNVARNPDLAKKLEGAGFKVDYKDPAGFANLIKDNWEILSQVIKETGMKAD